MYEEEEEEEPEQALSLSLPDDVVGRLRLVPVSVSGPPLSMVAREDSRANRHKELKHVEL